MTQNVDPVKTPDTSPADAAQLSPIKRALLAVEAMQAKLDAAEAARREPIAILGMGCRFPGGVESPADFWELLSEGRDAVREVPGDRWDLERYYDPNPDTPGRMYTRQGGFLDQVDQFNPQFFGISAREASSLDPQHRLLLEVSWEALEQAQQAPDRLFNSLTGVFIGICANDYNKKIWQGDNLAHVDAFSATGNALSVAAGRLSYTFGFRGPSLAVDTACSSALVAIHLACQHLRDRECNLALAGGVNLLLAPDSTIAFSKTRMLDPSGRCKTFDASANGYARGEGCGVIVLKRLSDAIADGDPILAVIRGSAVNHNGRSSSLIAPNGLAQQGVIRKALELGNLDPQRVGYVEVQGTGTSIGEPIEVGALTAVYGKDRPADQPLWVGSVKTNIGHLEAASGIASLIKVVLSMQHGEIPAHLHLQQPNPHIEWDKLPLRVPTQPTPWPSTGQPRLAAVSAFGFSGTNAHLVLEEAPAIEPTAAIARSHHLLTLSAKTETELTQLAHRYADYLQAHPDLSLADVCATANVGRSHLPHRLACLATTLPELQADLAAFQPQQTGDRLSTGKASTPPAIAFVFPGQGAGFVGMGRSLSESQPTFRATLQRCEEIVQSRTQTSLLELLYAAAIDAAPLNTSPTAQAALFAVEYALAQTWRSWGIEPSLLLGEGVGEAVAACVAEIWSLEDALGWVLAQSDATLRFSPAAAPRSPQKPILSARSGQRADTEMATLNYWTAAQPAATRLVESLEALSQQGCPLVLEISPQPLLSSKQPAGGSLTWLSSLNPTLSDWQALGQSLALLYVQGAPVNWQAVEAGGDRRLPLDLPTYPWQRQRYWVETPAPTETLTPELATLQSIDRDWMHQWASSGQLTPEELQLLPKLLDLLSQTPPTPAMSTSPPPVLQATDLTAESIQTWLTRQIAQELGVPPTDLDPQAAFDSYGLDSILALSIASAGQNFLGREVSPLLLLHYPTITALSQHLASEIAESDSEMFEL